MICSLIPELMPEFYTSYEPINKKFDPANLEQALEDWGQFSPMWKRKKPSVFGMVTFGSSHPRRPFHTSLLIQAKPEIVDGQKLIRFVQEFSKTFTPDIGLIHVMTRPEIESKRIFQMSSFILQKFLPNLYWATVFGSPYVKLFGKERLLSTPASVVTELADNLVYIQLTKDLSDGRKQPDSIELVREEAKKHLNTNAFFDSHLSPNHVYATPSFRISE
jgi:hypothetical protein